MSITIGSYFLAEASQYRSNTNKIGDNALLAEVDDVFPLSAAGAEFRLNKKKNNQHPFERLWSDGQAGNLPCAQIGDQGQGQEVTRDLVLCIATVRTEQRCWRWEEKRYPSLPELLYSRWSSI